MAVKMNNRVTQSILVAVLGTMLFLSACGDKQPPPPQSSQVVSKKIANTASPTDSNMIANTGTAKKPTIQEAKSTSELIKESLQLASTYNPKGRFDPFEPLFKDEPDAVVQNDQPKAKRKRRIPKTPLERMALAQLKVTAIIRAPSGNRALVEDAAGKGYVIRNGTYLGLNSGKVISIARDRIVIEEEVENVLGELTIQNTELKLQKPAGEL